MEEVELLKKAKRRQDIKKQGVTALFLAPYTLSYLIFGFIPLIAGIVISFLNYSPYGAVQTEFVGFDNYGKLFVENVFSTYFWNSLKTTLIFDVIAVPCLIIVPLVLAYLVNLKPPGHKLFRAIIYLPSVVSISIVGILFTAIFEEDGTGLFNTFFGTDIKFLSDNFLRWVVILIASIWWQTGGNFVILLAALKNVPKSLYEACEIDGGNKWHAFIKVTLPNIRSSIAICTFTTLIGYLGLYGQLTVITHVTHKGKIESPMVLLQSWMTDLSKTRFTGLITATAVFYGLIIMLFSGIQQIAMSERRGRPKHGQRFEAYIASK